MDDEVVAFIPVANQGLILAEEVIVVLEREDGTQIDVKSIPIIGAGTGWNLGPIKLEKSQWESNDSSPLSTGQTISTSASKTTTS